MDRLEEQDRGSDYALYRRSSTRSLRSIAEQGYRWESHVKFTLAVVFCPVRDELTEIISFSFYC